ncbi:helix-turn-helix domain-containing protein [Actinobaculum massiliense]|uniref:helix-turn-helix domain-containing protein n=1 Tax=Actinobaculum massiliense TaxID=202789 RepID=UPI00071AF39A|nr:helix-turn-helix transcriptional regulator [Actinobaculum massiliense]
MTSIEWLEETIGDDSMSEAARKSGFPTSTLTRQIGRGNLSAEVAVAIARAYGVDVETALIRQGLITEEEVSSARKRYSLSTFSDKELAGEIARRVLNDPGPELKAPLSENYDASNQ